MRKSGWAAAAGFGSILLLLTACGGSSSTSSTSGPGSTSTAQPGAQPSSVALAPPGSQVIIVQRSALGFVLALANGQVVYTYAKDTKGGAPTCTGSCASIWKPVTGNPVASSATKGLGTLGTVSDGNGAKQITYNGLPLYTLKGAKPLSTSANGGMWHVIKMSASNIIGS